MARKQDEYDPRNTGFINLVWNDDDKIWAIGGSFTDGKGAKFDLGYAKVGTVGLQEGIALIAKQLGPTLAGKGIPRKERQQNNGGRGEGPGGY